jgi:hypothetical protein
MEKKSVVYGPQPRTVAFGLVLGYSRPPFQGLALCGSRCNRKFEVLSSTHSFVSIPETVNPEENYGAGYPRPKPVPTGFGKTTAREK